MTRFRSLNWLSGIAVLAMAEGAVVAGLAAGALVVTPRVAEAQFFDQRYQQRPRGGGFFDNLFGGGRSRFDDREISRPGGSGGAPREDSADYSRAPSPRKEKADGVEPTTSIVVLGDSMADWLAYGLEDAFGDAPEIAVVRKAKQYSGLLRYDAKNELDWWHVARDLLAAEKPSYVVMMIGVGDRQNLRERDIAKEAEQKAKDQAAKDQAAKDQAAKDQAAKDQAGKEQAAQGTQPATPAPADTAKKEADDEQSIVAPEPKQTARRSANGVIEFRSEPWEKIYTRRIDDTIAALKSKGVPVFWVGLPPIRGTKSTSDVSYLNDLYRARAEKAGAIYIDVWDGFVDEDGKFTTSGPDYEGQVRRLRAGDGVYFTKYGARKLAHYVEREVRRTMANRGPIALPMGPSVPVPNDGKPAARPLAGPVVPLTAITGNNDELLGGGSASRAGDATAVLVKGDAVLPAPGRADDFVWPPGSERPKIEKPATPVAAPVINTAPKEATVTPSAAAPGAAPAVAAVPPASDAIVAPEAIAPAKPADAKPAEQRPAATRPVQAARPEPRPVDPRAREVRPPQQQRQQQIVDPRAPRPPQGFAQQPPPQRRRDDGGLFGIFR